MEIFCLPHQATTFFSQLNIDYLSGKDTLRKFYNYTPDDDGLSKAIQTRKAYPVNRTALVEVLKEQYNDYELQDTVRNNIELLLQDNTFTICTAHQPNLMTGYLYFFYKIIHAAKLAQHLKTKHPEANFVPVFYIGSEDNDLDELGVFRFNDKKFRWQTEQKGAVGRMHTNDLQPLLQELSGLIGPPGANADHLKEVITKAYSTTHTIAQATRYIINEFLGKFGIVVLDADDRRLKTNFKSVLEQELFAPKSNELVQENSEALRETYAAQAFSRPINLFYLKDDIRERIEQTTPDTWQVLHTNIRWNKAELQEELNQHPEHFSPNVILRGLYQESILPNVAFIGGGSEVAYWLQLKPVFEHYHVFYPALILRQSVQWVDASSSVLQGKIGLTDEETFQTTEKLVCSFVQKHTQKDLHLEDLLQQMNKVFDQLKSKAVQVDITLGASAEAALTKMRHQVNTMEKKMMRAEKRNMADRLSQIYKLKNNLFPNNSLQERYENFMSYYLTHGATFFDQLMNATLPYGEQFVILKEN